MSVDNMEDYWCEVYEGMVEEYEQKQKEIIEKARKGIWTSIHGEIEIKTMRTSHILNTINFIAKTSCLDESEKEYIKTFINELKRRCENE